MQFLTDVVASLQEEVNVAVEESLVGLVVIAKPLQKHMSQLHYLLHPMVVRLKERKREIDRFFFCTK